MNTKMLLFKLRLCYGISVHGENRVYRWLTEHPKFLEVNQLTIPQIIKIAKIYPKAQLRLKNDYNSQRLQNAVQRNLQESWISILDSSYPLQLKESCCPPNILFYRGNLKLLQGNLLGVVGARKYSEYASNAINKLLPQIIQRGITVVAGLAEGVDSLGHRCAIINHGNTIGVIGTGLDICYPRFNRLLQEYMSKTQLVITEYPLGIGPRRYHFPARNRIIAGLIETIVIVEAKQHSGSLITASLSLKNNRNVTAIPGRIDQPLSQGCNELISAGAKPILTTADLLEEFKGFN